MRKVLFVCVHNSARSQMAEAFLNHLGQGAFQAESAGLEKGTLNPLVVKAMEESAMTSAARKPAWSSTITGRGGPILMW